MDINNVWGTDIEILTFANLCQTNVYVYDVRYGNWNMFPPSLSMSNIDVSIKSVYLIHPIDHYNVVSSVRKAV